MSDIELTCLQKFLGPDDKMVFHPHSGNFGLYISLLKLVIVPAKQCVVIHCESPKVPGQGWFAHASALARAKQIAETLGYTDTEEMTDHAQE